jgi:hypothetical protein
MASDIPSLAAVDLAQGDSDQEDLDQEDLHQDDLAQDYVAESGRWQITDRRPDAAPLLSLQAICPL